jgi:hypothetical protein
MILSDIIKRVQRQFGDDVQAQITTDDIVRWVNDACLEIVTNNHTNQGSSIGNSPVEAGKDTYNLPADLYLLRAVRVNGKIVRGTTYEQLAATYFGRLSDTGEPYEGDPEWYWVDAGKLRLVPTPNTSLGSVDIMYVKRPDVLTASMLTIEPDVPTEYHPRIVEYCIAQAAELDDNMQSYQLKMSEFQTNLTKLKQNGEQPESDGVYASITYIVDGY